MTLEDTTENPFFQKPSVEFDKNSHNQVQVHKNDIHSHNWTAREAKLGRNQATDCEKPERFHLPEGCFQETHH
jgi:hypothetical protein